MGGKKKKKIIWGLSEGDITNTVRFLHILGIVVGKRSIY